MTRTYTIAIDQEICGKYHNGKATIYRGDNGSILALLPADGSVYDTGLKTTLDNYCASVEKMFASALFNLKSNQE